MEEKPRAGRPSTSKTNDSVERVRSLARSDRRLTLRMISSELNFKWFTVHQILTQYLDTRKVCAKMVQRTSRLSRRPMWVLIFWTALRGSQNSSVALSQVMNLGFWSTTPRQNAKVGREKHSYGSSAPYSQDLSPCDFFLFPRLKNHLKGRHFGSLDNIQKSVTDELKGIPAEAFQH